MAQPTTHAVHKAILDFLSTYPGSKTIEVGKALYDTYRGPGGRQGKSQCPTDQTRREWAKRHLSRMQGQGKVHQKLRGVWHLSSLSQTDLAVNDIQGESHFLDGVLGTLSRDGQVILTTPMFDALLRELISLINSRDV